MEKNSKTSSKCNLLCEKLLKALTGHPSFRKFRSLSNKNRQPEPTHKNGETTVVAVQQNVSNKEIIKDKKEVVPSYYLQIHAHEDNANTSKKQKGELKEVAVAVKKVEEKRTGDINDVFSDYINRSKDKLRSVISKGHDSNENKKIKVNNNNRDQHFSDYITRAKNKLRATSSSVGFGKGNSTSIKRD